MNVNCYSFWFSLTSQAVICGSSNCVGKQLLTNNRSQRKVDIKETAYATSWWIRLWNWSGQILIFGQVKSVLWSGSPALAWSIQRTSWATSTGMKMDKRWTVELRKTWLLKVTLSYIIWLWQSHTYSYIEMQTKKELRLKSEIPWQLFKSKNKGDKTS